MLKKIFGVSLFLAGLSLVIFFPSWTSYQPEEMSKLIVSLGIILISLGFYFLFS